MTPFKARRDLVLAQSRRPRIFQFEDGAGTGGRAAENIAVDREGNCEDSAAISQFRLKKFFTSWPEMISAKDNRVGAAIVTGLLDDPAAALAGATCLSAIFGPCRPTTLGFF
jgi:hypothetical protein